MNFAAARLIVFGAPGSTRRLVGIAAGVALGMAMLLILLGSYLHMADRDDRVAWQSIPYQSRDYDADGNPLPLAIDDQHVAVSNYLEYFRSEAFQVVRVAVTADTDVSLPGDLPMPRAGEYYASPALADWIASHPSAELGDRYGTSIGELPDAMLKGPDQIAVLAGVSLDDLQSDTGAQVIPELPREGTRADTLIFRIIVAVGSVALLAPIVLLIAIVSQLGASARRERYATVRLIGAGRRAMASLAGLEMAVASLIGSVCGVGLSLALRPIAGLLPINGAQSYPADLNPGPLATALAVLGMTVLGAATAWWRAWRDEAGALGSSRERPEKKATALRLIPLALGLVMFTASAWAGSRGQGDAEIIVFTLTGGFGLIAFGIVIAGSWVTKVASLAFRSRANSAPALVAAGRLARHPRTTFRSVAGVVIAVFIVSVLAGTVASVQDLVSAKDEPGLLPLSAMVLSLDDAADAPVAAQAAADVAGVTGTIIAYGDADDSGQQVVTRDEALALGLLDVPDAERVALSVYSLLAQNSAMEDSDGEDRAAMAPASDPGTSDPEYLLVLTDGSDATLEHVRTALIQAVHPDTSPLTRADYAGAGATRTTYQLTMLAYIGMAIAVGISALSLTVATVSAALDRARTFGLLRLSGMPVARLRAVVAYEAALPLGATVTLSAGLGFLVAYVLIRTLGNGLYFTWPDARYWWALAGSLAIAAAAVASSFGIVRRSTEIGTTRFE